MKITKKKLQKLIKEEANKLIKELGGFSAITAGVGTIAGAEEASLSLAANETAQAFDGVAMQISDKFFGGGLDRQEKYTAWDENEDKIDFINLHTDGVPDIYIHVPAEYYEQRDNLLKAINQKMTEYRPAGPPEREGDIAKLGSNIFEWWNLPGSADPVQVEVFSGGGRGAVQKAVVKHFKMPIKFTDAAQNTKWSYVILYEKLSDVSAWVGMPDWFKKALSPPKKIEERANPPCPEEVIPEGVVERLRWNRGVHPIAAAKRHWP